MANEDERDLTQQLDELIERQRALERELGIPVLRPLEEGLDRLVPIVREYVEGQNLCEVLDRCVETRTTLPPAAAGQASYLPQLVS